MTPLRAVRYLTIFSNNLSASVRRSLHNDRQYFLYEYTDVDNEESYNYPRTFEQNLYVPQSIRRH